MRDPSTGSGQSASGLQYFITDHLGSTVAITDSNGTLTSQQRYLPFGGTRTNVTTPNSPGTDFGYTGQRQLDAGMGGLMDYKARFYSPMLGRFIQPDTIIPGAANPQNWNRYSYVGNSPILYNDPTGHMRSCELGEICGHTTPKPTPIPNPEDEDEDEDNNLDFTGYLANVLTDRTTDPQFLAMQLDLFSGWLGLLFVERPGGAWDIKLKIGAKSPGIGLCDNQGRCNYYDYSTPGNIQLGYLVGLLHLNKKFADAAGGLVNTFDVKRGIPDATYGGCDWCDDPRDQAAVDFGYSLGMDPKYSNGITEAQLAAEFGKSPLITSFQPPPSSWVPPYPAAPGTMIYGPNDFDN